jgi:hypothetical protein
MRAVRVARDLREVERRLDDAARSIEEGRLADAQIELAEAQALLTSSNGDLYGALELEMVQWVPGVDANLESLRGSVALASVIVNGGRRILSASDPLESADGHLEVSLSDGSIPVEAVRAAREEIAALAAQLPVVPLEDEDRYLLPEVRDLRDVVDDEARERRSQLDALSRGLGLLEHLAGGDGDRRYLLAVANTAEMRGSGGMVLNYGVLEGAGGVIDLTEFGRIDELRLERPVSLDGLDIPEDYLDRWEGFDPTERWRNATMAGDFTVVAPILERMYETATDNDVDGVIQVDPQGLAAVLRGVGPVTVGELGEVSADNVVPLVLNEAYERYPGIEERSDVLGDVAEAAFRRLVDGDFPSLRTLGEAIVGAVDGRHLLLHSTTSAVDAAGAFFGASGALPAPDRLDSVHLVVQNVSANKLDYFLDTALHLSGARPHGRPGRLEAEVVLTNTAEPGATQPQYVFGPNTSGQEAGLYRGIVTLYLPTGTSLVDAEGDTVRFAPVVQTEGGRPLVSWSVDVPAGETRRLVLDLELAPRGDEPYSVLAVPSPRVRPTAVSVAIGLGGEGGDQQVIGEVVLDRTYRFVPGAEPIPLTGGDLARG